MENNLPQTPSNSAAYSPSPTEQPVPAQKNSLPMIMGGLVLLILGVGGGYYLGIQQTKMTVIQTLPSVSPAIISEQTAITSPTENVVVEPTPTFPSDPAVGMKSFSGQTEYGDDFSIKYPSAWEIKGKTLYPMGDVSADISNYEAPYVILGVGGHGGGGETSVDKVFPAGTAKYTWSENGGSAKFTKNEREYIFEAYYYGNPSNLSNADFEAQFNQMLDTLELK